jgi:hypothetical protein
MVESKDEAWVKEERRPEAILAAVPPPIFAGLASILLFSFFSAASSRERLKGGLYIVVFRSSPLIRDQDGCHRTLEEQTSLGGVT